MKEKFKDQWILINNREEFKEYIAKYRDIFGNLFDEVYNNFDLMRNSWHQFPTVIIYRDSAVIGKDKKYACSFQSVSETELKKPGYGNTDYSEYLDNIPSKVWKNPEDFPEYFL